MTEQRCETCRFFINLSECRRHAPTVPNRGPLAHFTAGRFPQVTETDWCGEWQSKAAAEAMQDLAEGLSDLFTFKKPTPS